MTVYAYVSRPEVN